jgi:hypothetical protein
MFLEKHGGVEDVYFYAFTIITYDDFNYLGKALLREVQMDTGALDESDNLDDRVAKELAKRKERAEARRHQHVAKKLRMVGVEPGEDVSGITPSIISSAQLLSATLSAQLEEYHEIES